MAKTGGFMSQTEGGQGWGERAMGFLQDPNVLMGMSLLMPNPADRQMLQSAAQLQVGMRQAEQAKKNREAEQELLDLRKQTMEHELERSQRRGAVGEQLAGLLATPGFNPQEAVGLLAQVDPFQAAQMAGIGAKAPQRRIMEDPRGIPRYIDSGEAVFPGITPPPPAAAAPKPSVLAQRGIEGWARDVMSRNALKRQRGERITDEDLADEANARQVLTQERIMVGPGGERYAYSPGVPTFDFGRAGTQPPAGQALPPDGTPPRPLLQPAQEEPLLTPGMGETPVPGGLLAPQQPGALQIRQLTPTRKQTEITRTMDTAGGQIRSIIDTLNEAKRAGETITGVIGSAKAAGGASIARQIGIPMSTRAESLSRQLTALKGILKPIIANEGGQMSDKDVADVERVVGKLGPFMDEQALRDNMVDLIRILQRIEGGQ